MNSPLPPIASPHGDGHIDKATPQPSPEIVVTVPVHLSFKSALRTSIGNLLAPTNFLAIFALSLIQTVLLIGTVPTHGPHPLRDASPLELCILSSAFLNLILGSGMALWFVAFSPHCEVELRPDGICCHYPKRDIVLAWSALIWLARINGDIWAVTSGASCLIPRESFELPSHSRRFVDSMNRLWSTQGAAWKTIFDPPNSHEQQPQ